ncbi:MAG: ATP-binding protein, partial [Armatimonadota bacterium]
DELAKKLHQIAVRMRPTSLDDLGLEAALRTFVEEWSNQNGIAAELETVGTGTGRLPGDVETTVYRVVQESLQNILKHAKGVSSVSVILRYEAHGLLAIIEDDGVGFDLEELDSAPPSEPGERRPLGIMGMRERAVLAGGKLDIESTLGKGTAVFLRLPLPTGETAQHSNP